MANVTFSANLQPAPACYPPDVNSLLALIAGGGLAGTVPDNAGGGIYVGSVAPDSSLTNKVWFKIDGAGRPLGTFMFYNGNWRKVYTGIGYGEIRIYIGSPVVFDGTGLGLIGGDFDGWALCNGNNGTPNLEGYHMAGGVWGPQVNQPAGWYTDADGQAWRSVGGQKNRIVLDYTKLPALQYRAFTESFQVGSGGGGSPSCLVYDGTKQEVYDWVVDFNSKVALSNVPGPLPFQHLYVAVAYIMFVGYA